MTLDKLPVGQTGVIVRVGGAGELRQHLLDMGLIPRTRVTMFKVAPMGDPVELHLRGYSLTLRREDARMIELSEGEETV
jgi:Fe2+ transport system protein FeoA